MSWLRCSLTGLASQASTCEHTRAPSPNVPWTGKLQLWSCLAHTRPPVSVPPRPNSLYDSMHTYTGHTYHPRPFAMLQTTTHMATTPHHTTITTSHPSADTGISGGWGLGWPHLLHCLMLGGWKLGVGVVPWDPNTSLKAQHFPPPTS
jgi:hypothetical protein